MNDFTLYQPTYYVFGKNTQSKVGELVKRFGGTKVLIHYGGGSVVRSGLLQQVQDSLNKAGIPYVQLGGVQPNPRSGLVYEGIELCRKEGIDFVLGIGGGSAIDSGKAISVGVPYDGDFWDFYSAKVVPTQALKHGCVLTLPATGTEGSNSAVVTHEDGMIKRGLSTDFNRPVFSILNPELTYTLPEFQTTCGIVDMMAHILERYFTNTTDVDLTDRMAEGALKAIIKAGPIAVKEPENYEARATLMWAGTVAHNGSLGVGRQEDWGSHNMQHELSALYDVAHGAGLSVVFPNWMRFVVDKHISRFAQYAVRVWNCEMDFENPRFTALEGIERTSQFFKSLNMPLTFEEIGAKKEDIPLMTQKARADAEGLLGNFERLTKEDISTIYHMCCRQ
ncbi:MAG: iron-containing alcohol dehydrogenase [Christensenellales bacterium]|jgi:alcohol dehydrogenase YqhD (iron-dependent ADH family)